MEVATKWLEYGMFSQGNYLSFTFLLNCPSDGCLLYRQCIYVLHGHTSTIRSLRVLHNRPIAVSGSRDSTLRVWDVQRGKCLRILAGHHESVRCLDVCGDRVVSGSYDSTCRVSTPNNLRGICSSLCSFFFCFSLRLALEY